MTTLTAEDPVPDFLTALGAPAGLGVLVTGLLLGIRHGIDWDHIAAITDITSTTAAAASAEAAHEEQHRAVSGHHHGHGGRIELQAHDAGPGAATLAPAMRSPSAASATPSLEQRIGSRLGHEQLEAIQLGTLYALGHGLVVIALGIAALAFGAILPDWVDPIMGRVVGLTLVALGVWVLYSVVRYARGGESFRLRSRWMLVFDGVRYAWRRFGARLHGHEHVEPLEMSSYGPRTAFGVGMIHGIGAEPDAVGVEHHLAVGVSEFLAEVLQAFELFVSGGHVLGFLSGFLCAAASRSALSPCGRGLRGAGHIHVG